MSTLDVSGLRAAMLTSRAEARRSIEVHNRCNPAGKAEAHRDMVAALATADQDRATYERAQNIADPDGALEVGPRVRVGREPATYRDGGPNSWFLDQWNARNNDSRAIERIVRNGRELRAAGKMTDEQLRALSGEAASGEALQAPLYLQEELVRTARVGRPYLAHAKIKILPPNVEVVIPKLKSGAATAPQKSLAEPEDVELVTQALHSPATVIGGEQLMARQLFERAQPAMLDGVLLEDLGEDYFGKADVQALTGNGTLPNLTGVSENSETNAVTFTEATPSLKGIMKMIAFCKWHTWKERLRPATHFFCHPNFWATVEEFKDTNERPILLPRDITAADAAAIVEAEGTAEGPVAKLMGLWVVLDSNLPSTQGASKEQSAAVIQRMDDVVWYEDDDFRTIIAEDIPENKELAIRISVFKYCAHRQSYAKGANWITGTGMKAPVAPTA
jgi:HK97 family phage major capsid protein